MIVSGAGSGWRFYDASVSLGIGNLSASDLRSVKRTMGADIDMTRIFSGCGDMGIKKMA